MVEGGANYVRFVPGYDCRLGPCAGNYVPELVCMQEMQDSCRIAASPGG